MFLHRLTGSETSLTITVRDLPSYNMLRFKIIDGEWKYTEENKCTFNNLSMGKFYMINAEYKIENKWIKIPPRVFTTQKEEVVQTRGVTIFMPNGGIKRWNR